jgi:hypothetical protein
MVNLSEKKELLQSLIENLERMIEMLQLETDPGKQFAPLFELPLGRARELFNNGFVFQDLKELSYSLEGLLHRSFLDYSPATFDSSTGRFSPIKGAEDYEEVAARVSALAFELRVVGHN